MEVLLISARRSAYTGESITAPHQGLLSLAATIREGHFHDIKGVNVRVVDEQLLSLQNPADENFGWLSDYGPDIVGVQTSTSSLKNAARLLNRVKTRFPKALRVIGGVGVATIADDLISRDVAEIAVSGEAEFTFSDLVNTYGNSGKKDLEKVNGICFKDKDGMLKTTPVQSAIKCLDSLPLPARDLVDMQSYKAISRGRAGNLITSRGCSYVCAYCYSKHQWGVGQRRFSVNRTLLEIRILVEEHGIDRIRIEDDDFLEDRRWVKEFCEQIIEQGLRIEWEAKARPDHIVADEKLIRLMKQSGCFRLLVGVETLDPNLLIPLRRTIKVECMEKALTILGQNGIGVQATLILGIPGESDKAMRSTLRWLDEKLTKKHDISSPCFFVPFYKEIAQAMSKHLDFTVVKTDTDQYTGHVPITSSPACSHEELLKLYDDMQPDRRGIYGRIAHLAAPDDIQQRMSGATIS